MLYRKKTKNKNRVRETWNYPPTGTTQMRFYVPGFICFVRRPPTVVYDRSASAGMRFSILFFRFVFGPSGRDPAVMLSARAGPVTRTARRDDRPSISCCSSARHDECGNRRKQSYFVHARNPCEKSESGVHHTSAHSTTSVYSKLFISSDTKRIRTKSILLLVYKVRNSVP